MICDKCKQRPAEVHIKQIENGVASELNLCGQCAGEMQFAMSFENLLQKFMDSFVSGFSGQAGQDNQPDPGSQTACPVCGMSFLDIKNTGRLGCAACYGAFKTEMEQVLRGIQGGSAHRGKLPRRGGAQMIQQRQAADLRRRLKKAVENEEYEEAASLRDQIRALEPETKPEARADSAKGGGING